MKDRWGRLRHPLNLSARIAVYVFLLGINQGHPSPPQTVVDRNGQTIYEIWLFRISGFLA